jgi:hypothetical protein
VSGDAIKGLPALVRPRNERLAQLIWRNPVHWSEPH